MIGQTLLVVSFVIGAAVGNLLLIQYGFRSEWWRTRTGRVLFALFAIIAASYDLTVLALLWPDAFDGGVGFAGRVAARFAIDLVLIALYVLTLMAQRRDRAQDAAGSLTPPEGVRRPG